MLIDGAVLFDEQIALGHVGLGLVVVVVADEVFHRVLRKELTELAVELRRQRLVGRKHNGSPAQACNHIGHGEGLARAGHTQQGLEHFSRVHPFHQQVDGGGLVTRRGVRLVQLEGRAGELDELPLGGFGGDFLHGHGAARPARAAKIWG